MWLSWASQVMQQPCSVLGLLLMSRAWVVPGSNLIDGASEADKEVEYVGRNVWSTGILKPGNREVQNLNGKGRQTWCQLRHVVDPRSTRLPTYKFHRATNGIRSEHGYKPF